MNTNSPYVSRQNTVLVAQNSQAMLSHIRKLQKSDIDRRISVIYIACRSCLSYQYDYFAACLFEQLFKEVRKRTRIKWFNLLDWFKFRRSNRLFAQIIEQLSKYTTVDELYTILANNHDVIAFQINRLVEKEQKEYALFVVRDFEVIDKEEQPVVASLLHRVVKGNPAYFRIIAVGEPTLFKKTASGEIGIQINNDYIEIQE